MLSWVKRQETNLINDIACLSDTAEDTVWIRKVAYDKGVLMTLRLIQLMQRDAKRAIEQSAFVTV